MEARSNIKGWCPSALRPMQAEDGLILRLRPWLGELSREQVLKLCELSERFASEELELTNRGNLQLRGIAEHDFDQLLGNLADLELIDEALEAKTGSNLCVAPDWSQGDVTQRLAEAFKASLTELPDLPSKFGFALDTGAISRLKQVPADIRVEKHESGSFLVYADSSPLGLRVVEDDVIKTCHQLTHWFAEHHTSEHRRMRTLLGAKSLPEKFTRDPVSGENQPMELEVHKDWQVIGVPLGRIKATDLHDALSSSSATQVRLTPWRSLIIDSHDIAYASAFILAQDNPRTRVFACVGAPNCASANGKTREIAERLRPQAGETVHISGCTKGCAFPRAATQTFLCEGNHFSLVKGGTAWDQPSQNNITLEAIENMVNSS